MFDVGWVGWLRLGVVEADPFGFPVFGFQQAHRPERRLVTDAWLAVLIPNADFPVAVLPRNERAAGVFELDGLIAFDFA